jgi:nucleotide-binding universal stress UspA family protein
VTVFPAKILVAVDGTPKSQRAVEAAAELCRATGSELLLMHVKLLSPPIAGDTPSPALHERGEAEGRALLDEEVARAEQLGVPVRTALVRMGRTIEAEIVRVADEIGATLLVLGTKARRPSGRTVRAGVSLDIVRDAPCSVWFVREEPRAPGRDREGLRPGTTVTHEATEE